MDKQNELILSKEDFDGNKVLEPNKVAHFSILPGDDSGNWYITMQELLNATDVNGNRIFKQVDKDDSAHFEINSGVMSDEGVFIHKININDLVIGRWIGHLGHFNQ